MEWMRRQDHRLGSVYKMKEDQEHTEMSRASLVRSSAAFLDGGVPSRWIAGIKPRAGIFQRVDISPG